MDEKTVRQVLKSEGSVTAAAKALGISRSTLYRLMGKYGIEVKRIVA